MLAAPHPTHSATVLPAAYHATHPRRTVPFIRDGELVLNESNTIVSYLANKYNRDGIYPESPEDLATAWQWLGERHPTPPWVSVTLPVPTKSTQGVSSRVYLDAETTRPDLRLPSDRCFYCAATRLRTMGTVVSAAAPFAPTFA